MVKTAIHTKTKEEFKRVLEIFDKKGWRWNGVNELLDKTYYWDEYKEENCIRYENYFGYSPKEWYLRNGYKIISFEEFLEIENAPSPEEIARQEMILNFKEYLK